MKRAIAETYDRLSPGGVITSDYCTTQPDAYDGALQADNEFVEDRGLSPEIVEGGLGLPRGQ